MTIYPAARNTFYSILLICLPFISFSQDEEKAERRGEFYFSWGYNGDSYTNSTIHVSQPALGNDYDLVNIVAHDRKGWNDQFFEEAISIPQYNYRFGYFWDKNKDWGVELNFDHVKYIVTDGQKVERKGTYKGVTVDSMVTFSQATGSYYDLNNGANFFLFNLVRRFHIVKSQSTNGKFKLDFLGKGGIGPVVPHVQNSFFGNQNSPHFQLGGWDVGFEGALRATFFNYVYLEYCNKVDYARYSGLRIYEGTVKQAFGTYEMVLNLGVTFPVGKRVQKAK